MAAERYERYWSVEQPSPLRDPLAARRRRVLWDAIAQASGRRVRLLDCGAGHGDLVAEAAARGHHAVGLEVSEAALRLARARHGEIDVRRHSVELLPWPVEAGSWDAVVSFEVIEHLLEPAALIQGARDALVAGGRLVLSTPYHGYVKRVALAAFAFERHFDVEGDHLRFFTDRSLRRLLAAHGFVEVRFTHLGRFAPLWANTVVTAKRDGQPRR